MAQAYDTQMMRLAITQAQKAAALGEVPVGAVITRHGEVISTGCNLRETRRSALAHAECVAIEAACAALQGWRLWECEIFVTLEPCPMCAGAAINARLRRVVYGASDPKAGCCGSMLDLFAAAFNHHPIVEGGLLREECGALLSDFFKARRCTKIEGFNL